MPTNTSAAAAIVISALPYTITITPDSATQDLWWTVTPDICDVVLGIRPWATDADYNPQCQFWEGPTAASLTAIASGTIYNGEEPIYFPVKPGVPVFIQIGDSSTGTPAAALTLTVDRAPHRKMSPGDLVIGDDARYYPAVVRSAIDGSILRYLPIIAGEDGASSGQTMLAADSFSSDVILYNRTASDVLATFTTGAQAITSNRTTRYYVVSSDDFYSITSGTLATMPYTLPFTNINAIAVDEVADVLYYTRPPANGAIRRLTLSDGTGDAELVPALSGYITTSDLVRLADGTIIAGYVTGSDNLIKRYSASGAELWSVSLGTDEIFHIIPDLNPLRFWVWSYPLASGEDGRFRLMDVTGAEIRSWDRQTHSEGQFLGTGTATTPIFGHSQSCTAWVVPEDCDVCGCECVCEPGAGTGLPVRPPTGLSGTAEGDDPTRELGVWTSMCAYGGTVPTGTNGTDTENWTD